MRRPSSLLVGLVIVLATIASACGSPPGERVLVSAAASLAGAFAEIETAFESEHPGVDVLLNLAGSTVVVEQVIEGAPVDVLATASEDLMSLAAGAGVLGGESVVFASNSVTIAVPRGNPASVAGLDDFGDENLFIGLCEASVPCGTLALEMLKEANVDPMPDTTEPNVKALVTKIEEGELDAGIVYVTDVLDGSVDEVEIPDSLAKRTQYPVALAGGSPNRDGGLEFIAFLSGPEGQRILRSHGFGTP